MYLILLKIYAGLLAVLLLGAVAFRIPLFYGSQAIVMKSAVLGMIRLYQRYLSPRKGFCCAYRVHTGHASCSQLGFRAIRRYGVVRGFAVLRQRTYRCGVAYRRYRLPLTLAHPYQRGFCDGGCDLPCDFNCDLPNFSGCNWAGDIFNSCGSCDMGSRKKKEQEASVHLPPRAG